MKRFCDIGVNFLDGMYGGFYNGSQKHPPDILNVLERAQKFNVSNFLLTCGSVEEFERSKILSDQIEKIYKKNSFKLTIGCHPTRCNVFKINDNYINELVKCLQENDEMIGAIGEIGLDYDRLEFCEKQLQYKSFQEQLFKLYWSINENKRKPLFIHCRNSGEDMLKILKELKLPNENYRGVVHSYDGNVDLMKELISLGFFIGINGCSLRSSDANEVIKNLPNNSLLLETDSPWCGIKATHQFYSHVDQTLFNEIGLKKKEKWNSQQFVRGRNEPAFILQVFDVICHLKEVANEKDKDDLARQIFENSLNLFSLKI
ncbi:hypothetical protein SNEBB_008946 [Seison nebaliae]|nr:hypothetical protein SNEBB_008946 [Seison nebaliae]